MVPESTPEVKAGPLAATPERERTILDICGSLERLGVPESAIKPVRDSVLCARCQRCQQPYQGTRVQVVNDDGSTTPVCFSCYNVLLAIKEPA